MFIDTGDGLGRLFLRFMSSAVTTWRNYLNLAQKRRLLCPVYFGIERLPGASGLHLEAMTNLRHTLSRQTPADYEDAVVCWLIIGPVYFSFGFSPS